VVLLNFHALVSKLPSGEQNRLAKKILREGKLIKTALSLEREASQLAKLLIGPKTDKPSQIYTLLSSAAPALVLFLLVYDTRAAVQNRIKAFFTKYPAIRAELPRSELQALGLPPGPKFDRVMDQVFIDQLDGKIKSPQQLTKLLMDYAGIKVPPPPPVPKAIAKTAAGKSPAGKAAGLKVETQQPAAAKAGVSPEADKLLKAKPTVTIKPDSAEPKRPQSPPIAPRARAGAGSIAPVAAKREGSGAAAARPSPARAPKISTDRKSTASSRQSSGPKGKPKIAKADGASGKRAPTKVGKSR
jgi:hypothetical protein